MQRMSRKQQFILTLPGLVLLAAFFIASGTEGFLGAVPHAAEAHSASQKQARQDASACNGAHHKPSFGSTVVVPTTEVVCGDLTSFGGSVLVQGDVEGDIVTFGGNVVIDGNVNGNVTIYAGNLTLQNDTHVNGDVHVCGGRSIGTSTGTIHGSTFTCTQSIGALLTNDVGFQFRFWYTLTWIALGLLLTFLLPEHVMFVRTTARSKFRRSLILGLLSVLLAPVILMVLAALIISIPLAIIIIVGLVAAWALGTVAIGWLIGDSILRAVSPQQHTRLLQIVVGMTLLALAGSLPYFGWFISLATGLIGLGAVFLSRFGTRLYAQPRQPLPL